MPVTIAPPRPLRERILAYGGTKVGKSRALASIMARIPDQSFYIIDNDASYERTIYSDEFEEKLGDRVGAKENGIHLYDIDEGDWPGHLDAIREIEGRLTSGNWFGLDLVTPTWSLAVLNWFDELIFGSNDHAEYAVHMRQALEADRQKAKETGGKEKRTDPLYDAFRDWGTINPEYRKLYSAVKRMNRIAHVYLVAEEQLLRDNDDPKVREMFGSLKYRPSGQKSLGHLVHTAIRFHKDVRRGFLLSTAGDRQRELLDEEPYEDFAKTYLMGVAGWKIKKVPA